MNGAETPAIYNYWRKNASAGPLPSKKSVHRKKCGDEPEVFLFGVPRVGVPRHLGMTAVGYSCHNLMF